MKRDFSEEARQQLLSLISQVENEKWCNFTDQIGDAWYDFQDWVGALDIQNYIDDVNTYHKKVIDKNNADAAEINQIFSAVNTVSDRYRTRCVALLADLQGFKKLINSMADVINPAKGNFQANYIGNGLKNAINEYLTMSETLAVMAGDGLTQEDVANMGEDELRHLLEKCAEVILENIPDVGLGGELKLPIGPGVVLYYKVSGKLNGTGDVDINFAIKEQKLKLKSFDFSHDFGNGVSASIDNDREVSVSLSKENMPTFEASPSGVKISYETEDGANTYAYKFEAKFFPEEMSLEEKVTTDFDAGSISSALGIKYSKESDWQPLPEPVLVEDPYLYQQPAFSSGWEAPYMYETPVFSSGWESPYVYETPSADLAWIVVGAVAYVGLAYLTGGLTLLCPI